VSSASPRFRSKFEETIWEAAKRNRRQLEFEPHYVPYVIKGSYLPDFKLPNGIYVEAKGKLDAGTCRKMKAVKAANPNLDIRFVFMRANNPMRRGSKMRYWEWAEKNGFPWAEGTIPLEWWKEKNKNG